MNYGQLLDHLCSIRARRVTRSTLYFKGYIDGWFDAGFLTYKEQSELYRIFDIKEVW